MENFILHCIRGWHESLDSEVISEQEIKMEAVQHVSNGRYEVLFVRTTLMQLWSVKTD